jgi:hypothetical protein
MHKEEFLVFFKYKYCFKLIIIITIIFLGVKDMKLSQVDSLINNGVAMSSKFKTYSKYLLQPVTLSEISKNLLVIYLKVLRPVAATKMKIKSMEEPLWITFNGGNEIDVGKLVSNYFKRKLNISITTTNIRSLVETETETLFRNGIISKSERSAISLINGHTSQTTNDYYVRENMTQNVDQARNVFSYISNKGTNLLNQNNVEIDDSSDQNYNMNKINISSSSLDPAPSMINQSIADNNFNNSLQQPVMMCDYSNDNNNYNDYYMEIDANNNNISSTFNDNNYIACSTSSLSSDTSTKNHQHDCINTKESYSGTSSLPKPNFKICIDNNFSNNNIRRLTDKSIDNNSYYSPTFLTTSTAPIKNVEYSVRKWGENHPEFEMKNGLNERAEFSQAEKNYLIPLAIQLSSISSSNLMARCLKHIKNDPLATPIFHKRHIMDSGRLQSCWKTYKKNKNDLELDD